MRSSTGCSRLLPTSAKGLVADRSVRLLRGVPLLELARSEPACSCLVVDVGVVSARPPTGISGWGATEEPEIAERATPGRYLTFLALAHGAAWLDNPELPSLVGMPSEDMRGFLLDPEFLWTGVILADGAFPRP